MSFRAGTPGDRILADVYTTTKWWPNIAASRQAAAEGLPSAATFSKSTSGSTPRVYCGRLADTARMPLGARWASVVPDALRVSPGLSAAGFQEMRPAWAPTWAGMGDAVTGINRADSASCELNALTLRQYREACTSSHCCGHLRLPDWQALCVRAASRADSACRSGRARRLTHLRASLA
jgi:hypothetical protein